MTSEYQDIFNRVFGKINDNKLANLDNNSREEIMMEWMHSVASNVRVRNIFSKLKLDDDVGEISFELVNPIDDDSDMEFVHELFVTGMMIAWLEPQVNSIIYAAPMIGGKEEKKVLDTYRYNIQRLETLKIELKKMIRDRGYIRNTYIES